MGKSLEGADAFIALATGHHRPRAGPDQQPGSLPVSYRRPQTVKKTRQNVAFSLHPPTTFAKPHAATPGSLPNTPPSPYAPLSRPLGVPAEHQGAVRVDPGDPEGAIGL